MRFTKLCKFIQILEIAFDLLAGFHLCAPLVFKSLACYTDRKPYRLRLTSPKPDVELTIPESEPLNKRVTKLDSHHIATKNFRKTIRGQGIYIHVTSVM